MCSLCVSHSNNVGTDKNATGALKMSMEKGMVIFKCFGGKGDYELNCWAYSCIRKHWQS